MANSETGDCPYEVEWYWDIVEFNDDITRGMERYLLLQQAIYRRNWVEWAHISDGKFQVLFDRMVETCSEPPPLMQRHPDAFSIDYRTEDYKKEPWQLPLFSVPKDIRDNVMVPRGQTYTTIRRVPEYADYYRVGDKVNVIFVPTMKVVAAVNVVAIKKVSFHHISLEDYSILKYSGIRTPSLHRLKRQLEVYYEHPLKEDEVVTVLTLQTNTPVLGNKIREKSLSYRLRRFLERITAHDQDAL